MAIPEHIEPGDGRLTDEQINEIVLDRSGSDPFRAVADAASAKTALYLGMYYAQYSKEATNHDYMRRLVASTMAQTVTKWYTINTGALDLHALSDILSEMLAQHYGLCTATEDGLHDLSELGKPCRACGEDV